MTEQGIIDVHGLSVHGSQSQGDQDQFAIADIAKSMRLHQSTLSIEDEARLHGDSQGHVFLLVERIPGAEEQNSTEAVDSLVHYFLNELPWTDLTQGEPNEVVHALEDAVWNCRRGVATSPHGEGPPSMTLAFVNWPELFVARVGRGSCQLLRDGQARDLAAGPTADDKPAMERRTLEHGDVLALVNGHVAQGLDLASCRARLDANSSAEDWATTMVGGRGEEDRTAIAIRFVPRERQLAARLNFPTESLGAQAERAS